MLNILFHIIELITAPIEAVIALILRNYCIENIYTLQILTFIGVNVHQPMPNCLSPMIYASYSGKKELVSALIKNGADVNQDDEMGYTPLILASQQGHKDIALLLIANEAKVDHLDLMGSTALMYASSAGHKDIALLLIEKGADVNRADSFGCTALMCASSAGHKDIALLLIEKGASVNQRESNGWTALMYASSQGHKDIALLLMENGADATLINFEGDTASALAQNEDCRKIIITAQMVLKKIFKENLSEDEIAFLNDKNNAELIDKYLKDRNSFILRKIFANKELAEQEKKFIAHSDYLQKKLHETSEAAVDSVYPKLSKDLMFEVLKFIPTEEALRIGPNLIAYSNQKQIAKSAEFSAINPQKQFVSGALVGTFIINPTIRCGRDKVNAVDNDKALIEYYQEILTLDNLSDTITAFIIPTVTQMITYSLGISTVVHTNPFAEIAAQITDSPFAQGLIQSTLIEGARFTMDVLEVLGHIAYCKVYECEQ